MRMSDGLHGECPQCGSCWQCWEDTVTRLRQAPVPDELVPVEQLFDLEDEIERLRAERLEWFLVARQLRDALVESGNKEPFEAFDEYLRTRGRLEDPREQAKG